MLCSPNKTHQVHSTTFHCILCICTSSSTLGLAAALQRASRIPSDARRFGSATSSSSRLRQRCPVWGPQWHKAQYNRLWCDAVSCDIDSKYPAGSRQPHGQMQALVSMIASTETAKAWLNVLLRGVRPCSLLSRPSSACAIYLPRYISAMSWSSSRISSSSRWTRPTRLMICVVSDLTFLTLSSSPLDTCSNPTRSACHTAAYRLCGASLRRQTAAALCVAAQRQRPGHETLKCGNLGQQASQW